MNFFFDHINRVFDWIRDFWEGHVSRGIVAALILVSYLVSLVVIELGRRGLLPHDFAAMVPRSHYAAINVAFTFLLYVELVDLVLGLARSVSKSMGKQFEIFSLILLRESFKDFSELPEPLHWPASPDVILHILSSAVGALLIFAILFLFYRMLNHRPITINDKENYSFISTKKAIALLLLVIFAIMGVHHLTLVFGNGTGDEFFAVFYTVLVFCDVLIVLVSLRYSHAYPVIFRNSGFALASVMLRMGLAAPPYYNACLGVGAMLYILGLNAVYNMFGRDAQRTIKI